MADYQNLKTGQVLTECELYDCLIDKCCYKCSMGWAWENLTTHVVHTGQVWLEIFQLNPPFCDCADIGCPNGREVGYFNIIESISMGGMSSQFVQVTLNAATFIDNESLVPPTPDYIVDWGDGSPTQSITIGQTLNHAPATTGIVKGSISWQDASVDFWYEFNFGVVTNSQTERISSVDYDLDCTLYPSYPVDITDSATITTYTVRTRVGAIFGQTIYSLNATGQTYSESGQLLTDYTLPSDQIVTSYSIRFGATNIQTFRNTSVLRTKCID